MNDYEHYNFRLEVDEPERVDKLISNYLLEYSRSTIQKWITNNEVLIDGIPCSKKDKLKSSCNVSIRVRTDTELDLVPEDIDIDIIDETKDYIIVNKKSGMVTHIAPGNYTGTLQNALFYRYPELSRVPRTGIIHRLDKNTSGVLVIARNLIAHNNLSNQLQNNKFIKIYHALTSGLIQYSLDIDEPIGRHPVNRKKMTVTNKGKQALSKVKLLDDFGNISHVEIQIITGRTHQIRVHLSHINKPVIGDRLYGFKKNNYLKYPNTHKAIDPKFFQYLHAYSLSFFDPRTNRIKKYKAVYPDQYAHLLKVVDQKYNDKKI